MNMLINYCASNSTSSWMFDTVLFVQSIYPDKSSTIIVSNPTNTARMLVVEAKMYKNYIICFIILLLNLIYSKIHKSQWTICFLLITKEEQKISEGYIFVLEDQVFWRLSLVEILFWTHFQNML